jgi:hypothetical protein
MIENISNNHVAPIMGMNATPHADTMNRSEPNDLDATLQINFADMVNQALQATETDTDAVQKARELLQSNSLTTPENIQAAAENILKFGV